MAFVRPREQQVCGGGYIRILGGPNGIYIYRSGCWKKVLGFFFALGADSTIGGQRGN
ncbi:unnamed protein product [Prunus brigantina]